MLLAMHAGGTPWEWREHGDEMDWATALTVLHDQAERMKDK